MTEDDGLTLIETVIAMLVMSIAVVALVSALAGMINLAEQHRGNAVTETTSRSFAQAVQALAESSASLVSLSGSTLTVADASTLPPPGDNNNSYLLVDREVLQVTAIDRSNGVLTVVRGVGGSVSSTHAVGSTLAPLLDCPSIADLTPPTSAYKTTSGVTAAITTIDYWQASTRTWVDRATCQSNFQKLCPSPTILPECSDGLFRVSIAVATPGDPRLKGVGTTTSVLVRSGSV